MSTIVEFVRARPPYNPGERAGFKPARAAELVAGGFARYLSGTGKGAPAERRDKQIKSPPASKGPGAPGAPGAPQAPGAPDAPGAPQE